MHDDFFSFVASTGAGSSPDPILRFASMLPLHGSYFSSEVQPLLLAALLNTVILRCASGASSPSLDLGLRLLTCDALPASFRARCRVVLARILVHAGSKNSHEVLLALTQNAQMQPAVCSANEAAASLLMRDSFVHSDVTQCDADENTNLHISHSVLLAALCVYYGSTSVALPTVQQKLARCTQSSMMWDIAASVAHSSGALRRTVVCCKSAQDRQCCSAFSRLLEAKSLIRIGDSAAAVAAATAAVSATEGTSLSTTAHHVLGVALGLSSCHSGSLQNHHELVSILNLFVRIEKLGAYLLNPFSCPDLLSCCHLLYDSQLVRAIEQLKIATTDPAYPLKSSAQASLALALAHSRDVTAAADACRAALELDPRNDRAAALFLLLSSVLQPTDDVLELATLLKSQLPNSVLVTSVTAGLEVLIDARIRNFSHIVNVCRAGGTWAQ